MSIPPLRHAFLAHIAADWEDFAELRRAASARGHRSRLSNAVSILVNEIRVSMAAALLSAPLHGSAALDAAAASEATAKAARLYAYARTIIADGRAALVEAWHFTAEQCDTVLTCLASAVGPPPRLGTIASSLVWAQADSATVRTEGARVPRRGRSGHGNAACYHGLQPRRQRSLLT